MCACCLVLRVVDGFHLLCLVVRIVGDDQLHGIEHSRHTQRLLVKVFAHGSLKERHVVKGIKLGVAYRLDEVSDALRRVATTAHATEGRHTRIVPSCHEVFVNEGVELTLRHHSVGKVQAVKLDLSRTEVVQVLCLATHLLQVVDEQIVERTVRHKLERTD